jgi:hypothetical protein
MPAVFVKRIIVALVEWKVHSLLAAAAHHMMIFCVSFSFHFLVAVDLRTIKDIVPKKEDKK